MRQHRRTDRTVPNDLQQDNFDPADALETLHASILRVDTLIHIASRAADELQCPSSIGARRAFTRMQILISKAAEEASAVLAQGDKLMSELASQLKTQRAQQA